MYNILNLVDYKISKYCLSHLAPMLVFIYCRYKSSVDKANVQEMYDTNHNHDNIAAVNSTEA